MRLAWPGLAWPGLTWPDLAGRAHDALRSLGADPSLIERRKLPLYADAEHLVVADMARRGRAHLATPPAAVAWQAMRHAAELQQIRLIAISAYRGFDYQFRLIRRRLDQGLLLDEVLRLLAPAGCSEHHTGRAFDIGTPGCEPASEAFANTAAFEWLQLHAARFGFSMSFPPDNAVGYRYEPWHWCWAGSQPSAQVQSPLRL